MTDPIYFTFSVLALLGTPGPTNTLLATSGALAGIRRSLPLLAGELVGYLLAIAIIRLVLGPVLAAEPAVGNILKVFVALYLTFVAVKLWTASASAAASVVGARRVFTTTLCNPKAFVFAFGIFPPEDVHTAGYFAAFSVCVVSVGFLWVMFGNLAGSRHSMLVSRIASIALGGFASVILASTLG